MTLKSSKIEFMVNIIYLEEKVGKWWDVHFWNTLIQNALVLFSLPELNFKYKLLEDRNSVFVLSCMFSAWHVIDGQKIITEWKNECKPKLCNIAK